LGDGSFVWHHIMASLDDLGSAAAIDLRGHGDSPRDPACAYTTEHHVLDVCAALRKVCARPVVLVGHSLGAEIALRLWATERDRIRGLVLVDGGPQLASDAMAFSREQFAMQPWCYRSIDEYVDHLQERLPLTVAPLLRALAPHALRTDVRGGFQLKCDRALSTYQRTPESSLWPLFSAISCPILLIRGAGSAILPQSIAMRMTRENARCALQTVPLAGHAVMLDNPFGFVAALKSHAAILVGGERS
jgi:pimeloyl-ACP methyl ester carboxylesterase